MKKAFLLVLAIILVSGLIFSGCAKEAGAPAPASYPKDNITLIVPAGPGGGYDTWSRATASFLPNFLPEKVGIVVENIAPPVYVQGLTVMNRSKPDGYTLASVYTTSALLTQLQQDVEWDLREMVPLGAIMRSTNGVCVRGDSPYKTIADVANANKKVRWAVIPGFHDLAARAISKAVGLDSEIIGGYKGTADLALAMIRGDADLTVGNMDTFRPYFESGDLRPLFSLSLERYLEGVPCATELGFPMLEKIGEASLEYGSIYGPPGLPQDIAGILTESLGKMLSDEGFLKLMGKVSIKAGWETPEVLTKHIAAGYEVWSEILKEVAK